MTGKTAARILLIVVGTSVLAAALYIMLTGAGLQDSLDFGAGAYYYADIPEFEKYVGDGAFSTSVPFWVHVALFLVWGFLMYRLWVFIDRKK